MKYALGRAANMTENFLPDFQPVTTHGTEKTIQCLVRDKAIRVTPEECVRQRVLNWLMGEKGWRKDKLRLEENYTLVSDPARFRIRPDIELLDDKDNVLVVVECKREKVPLGECVDQQAIAYARKARSKWIWTTNGKSHGFLKKTNESDYQPVEKLGPLEVFSDPPVAKLEFPASIDDHDGIANYWKTLNDPQFLDEGRDYDRRFVLAIHRVLFDRQKVKKELPFSHGGVHILEDCGSAWHSFGNRGGGRFHTRYADFIAATRGRVEAVSVAVNRRRCRAGLRLCVGVRKPKRSHHALQLNTDLCERVDETRSWRIFHDGRMSNIQTSDVFEAVIEAGSGQWITQANSKDRVFLGDLPDADSANWKNSRVFLANLVHYAIIRTNLREANSR